MCAHVTRVGSTAYNILTAQPAVNFLATVATVSHMLPLSHTHSLSNRSHPIQGGEDA